MAHKQLALIFWLSLFVERNVFGRIGRSFLEFITIRISKSEKVGPLGYQSFHQTI